MAIYKLGKQPVRHDTRTLRLAKYLTSALPTPPALRDWSKGITAWGMMANDSYGDCTCAAAGHMIMAWTANVGGEVVLPDQVILAAYDYFSQGNPDAGANMLDVLKYWRHQGLSGHAINSFVALELKSHTEAMDAVNLFGAAYIGVALPNSAVPDGVDPLTIPWVVPPQGPVGEAAPNQDNGHCIPAVGYDARNLYVVTWGALKAMSWQFYDAYTEESYAVLSPDWFDPKKDVAPVGFDRDTLQRDLAQLG